MMVQRMIGCKIGTGGTSGYQYLRSTVRWVRSQVLGHAKNSVPDEYGPEATVHFRDCAKKLGQCCVAIALWDCLGMLSFLLAEIWVKILSQNCPTVQFDTTLTQSQE